MRLTIGYLHAFLSFRTAPRESERARERGNECVAIGRLLAIGDVYSCVDACRRSWIGFANPANDRLNGSEVNQSNANGGALFI